MNTPTPAIQCVWRQGCRQPAKCLEARRCTSGTVVAESLPPWPMMPSGKVPGMFLSTEQDADNWREYHHLVQMAAIARVRLARDKLVTLAAECNECHGKRCIFCEDIWLVIDKLEVPTWMR